MKIKIIVEETITQEFEVEINDSEDTFDQIQTMYKNGKLVIEEPNLIDAQLTIFNEDGQDTGWCSLL